MRAMVRAVLSKLGTKQLAVLAAVVLAVDLFVPDPIPLVDEVLLALATLLLARRTS